MDRWGEPQDALPLAGYPNERDHRKTGPRPDLVLLLPVLDGWHLIEEHREARPEQRFPIPTRE